MTWEEYKLEALKTWNKDEFTEEQAFEYIIMKLIEEFGELMGSLAKEKYHGKPNNNIEELGDIYWYLAVWESMVDETTTTISYSYSSNLVDEICYCLITLINVRTFTPVKWTNMHLANLKSRVDAIVCNLNLREEHIWQANITKLRARHGESYNAKHYTGEERNG